MFEGFIADLLNRFLGPFVENVSSKDLSASVWSGKVNLTNLKVKSSGLDFLKLPVQVIQGFIGTLSLHANWRSLRSQPVRVELSDVYVLVGPRSEHADALATEEILRAALENKLAALLLEQQSMLAREEERAANKGGGPGLGGQIVAEIIDNIQVRVRNIHVRYEDHSNPQAPLALGFALENLSADTTDRNWAATKFVAGEEARKVFKLLQLTNLMMYLNTDSQSPNCQPVKKVQELSNLFDKGPDQQPQDPRFRNLEYVLYPLNGKLRLTSDKTWMETKDTPQFLVQASLDVIHMGMSRHQYVRLLTVTSSMSGAASIHGIGLQQEDSLPFREASSEERTRYVSLYKRTLNALWDPALTEKELKDMQSMEKEIQFRDLARARQVAVIELRRQLPSDQVVSLREVAEKKNAGGRWFPFGGSSKPMQPTRYIVDRERQELLDSENVVESSGPSLDPDKLTILVDFELKGVMLSLASGKSDLFANLTNERTVATVRMYPESMWVELSVDDIKIEDLGTPNTLFRQLVTPTSPQGNDRKAAAASSNTPFLHLQYQSKPLNKDVDSSLKLTMQQRQIALHVPFVATLIDFVSPPQDLDIMALYSWSATQLDQLKRRTQSSLAQQLANRSRNEITVKVIAPLILVPRSVSDPATDVIVLDLGKLDLSTELQPPEQVKQVLDLLKGAQSKTHNPYEELLSSEQQAKCYDRYRILFTHIRLFLAEGGPNWHRSVQTHDPSQLGGLEPLDMTLTVATSVAPDVLWLPSVKLDGEIPMVSLRLTLSRYRRMVEFATALASDWSASRTMPDIQLVDAHSDGDDVDTTTKLWNWALSSSAKNPLDTNQNDQDSADAKLLSAADSSNSLRIDDLARILGSRLRAEEVIHEMDPKGTGEVTVSELRDWWRKHKQILKHDITLKLQMRMREARLIISDDSSSSKKGSASSPHGTHDVLHASLLNTLIGMKSRTFDSEISASIQGLLLEDRTPDAISTHGQPLAVVNTGIVETPDDEKSEASAPGDQLNHSGFVVVHYAFVDPSSPDLELVETIPQRVKVDVGHIVVTAEPSCLHRLTKFALVDLLGQPPQAQPGSSSSPQPQQPAAVSAVPKAISPSGGAPVSPSSSLSLVSSSSAPKAVAVEANDDEEKSSSSSSSPLQAPSDEATPNPARVLLQVDMKVAKVAALVLFGHKAIARVDVDGFSTAVVQRPLDLDVDVVLQSVSVRDMTPAGFNHPLILQSGTNFPSHGRAPAAVPVVPGSSEGALIAIHFGNAHRLSPKFVDANVVLDTRIRGIRVVCLMRFVSELLQYLQSEPMTKFLALFGGEDAQPELPEAPETSSTPGLPSANVLLPYADTLTARLAAVARVKAKLSEVEVLVPRHSTSSAVTFAALDAIEVYNEVEAEKNGVSSSEDDAEVFQRWVVSLSSFQLATEGARHRAALPGSPVAVPQAFEPTPRHRRRRSSTSFHFSSMSQSEVEEQVLEADADARRLLLNARPSTLSVELKHHIDTLNVQLKLGQLQLSLSQWQYNLIMNTLAGNLLEAAVEVPLPPQGPVAQAQPEKAPTTAAQGSAAKVIVLSDEELVTERVQTMHITAALEGVTARLLAGKGATDTDGLVDAQIQKTGLQLTRTLLLKQDRNGFDVAIPLQGLDMKAKVQGIEICDISPASAVLAGRPVLSPYRRLMHAPPVSSKEPCFNVEMKQQPRGNEKGPVEVDVVLNAVIFNIGSDAVLRSLAEFFVIEPSSNPDFVSLDQSIAARLQSDETDFALDSPSQSSLSLSEASEAESKHDALALEHSAPVVAVPPSDLPAQGNVVKEAQAPIYLNVELKQVCAQMFMDPTSESTTAISLILESHSTLYTSTIEPPAGSDRAPDAPSSTVAATLEIENVSIIQRHVMVQQDRLVIAATRADDATSSSIIMEPFSVRAGFRRSPSALLPNRYKLAVDVDIDQLNVRLAVTSIAHVNQMLAVVTAAAALNQNSLSSDVLLLESADKRFGVKDLTVEGMSAAVLEEEADLEQLRGNRRRLSLAMARGRRASATGLGDDAPQDPALALTESEDSELATFGEQSIEIQFGGAEVLLLNDYHHSRNMLSRLQRRHRRSPAVLPAKNTMVVPVARVSVQEAMCRLVGYEHERSISVSSHVTAYFYNHKVLGWEPIVEPTQLQFRLNSSVTSLLPANQTALEIALPKPIEINFSQTMMRGIENIRQLLQLASQQQQLENSLQRPQSQAPQLEHKALDPERRSAEPGAAHKVSGVSISVDQMVDEEQGVAHPYVLRNFTEFDVTVSIVDQLADTQMKDLIVKAGKGIGFDVASDEVNNPGAQSTAGVANPFSARIAFHQTPWWPTIPVDLRRVQVSSWDLNNAAQGLSSGMPTRTSLIVQIEDNGFGVKLITLHSQLCIHNSLTVPMRLFSSSQQDNFQTVIPPQDTVYLPLMSTAVPFDGRVGSSGAKLRFQPLVDGLPDSQQSFLPTHPVLLAHKPKAQQRIVPYTLSCDMKEQQDHGLDSFAFCVQRAIHTSTVFTTFVLSAPIQFFNYLAYPVDISLSERSVIGSRSLSRVTVAKTRLAPGRSIPLTDLSIAKVSQDPQIQARRLQLQLNVAVPHLQLTNSQSHATVHLPEQWQPDSVSSVEPEKARFVQHHVLQAPDGKRSLRLALETLLKPSGMHILFFVPFWVVDLTGLHLSISADRKNFVPNGVPANQMAEEVADIVGQVDGVRPALFHFPSPELRQNGTASLCLEQKHPDGSQTTLWSDPFGVTAGLGTNQSISLATSPARNANSVHMLPTYQLCTQITELPDIRFHRTKLIKIVPRFVLCNKTPFPLVLRQFGSPLSQHTLEHMQLELAPGDQKNLFWPCPIDGSRSLGRSGSIAKPLFQVRRGRRTDLYPNAHSADSAEAQGQELCEWSWSGFINPHVVKPSLLSMTHLQEPFDRWYMQVDVRMKEGTSCLFVVFETLKPERLEWYLPCLIENKTTNHIMYFRQHIPHDSVVRDPEQQALAERSGRTYHPSGWIKLPPYTSTMYTWDEPTHAASPKNQLIEVQIGTACLADGSSGALQFVKQSHFTLAPHNHNSQSITLQAPKGHTSVEEWLGSQADTSKINSPSKLYVRRRKERSTDTDVVTICNYDLKEVEPLMADASAAKKHGVRNLFNLKADRRRKRAEEAKELKLLLRHCEKMVMLSQERLRQERQRFQVVKAAERVSPRPNTIQPAESQLAVYVSQGSGFNPRCEYRVKITFAGCKPVQSAKNVQGPQPKFDTATFFPVNWMQKVESSLISITVWQVRLFNDVCLGGVVVPLGMLSAHIPVNKVLPLRKVAGTDELIGPVSASGESSASLQVKLWWVAPAQRELKAMHASLNSYFGETRRVFKILQQHQRWLASHSRSGVSENPASSLVEGVPKSALRYLGTPTALFTLRLHSVQGLLGLVSKLNETRANLVNLNQPGSKVVCVVDFPIIKRKAHFVVFDPLVDEDASNSDSDSSSPRSADSTTKYGGMPPAIVTYGEKLLGKLGQRIRLAIKAPAEEQILYHVVNSSNRLDKTDQVKNCVVLTNQRLVKLQDRKLAVAIALDQVAQVDHQKRSAFRYDKLKFVMVDGVEEDLGIFSSQAAAFFTKVIDSGITDRGRAQLSAVRLRRLEVKRQKQQQQSAGDASAPKEMDGLDSTDLVCDSILMWDRELQLPVPEELLSSQQALVSVTLFYLPADSLSSMDASGNAPDDAEESKDPEESKEISIKQLAHAKESVPVRLASLTFDIKRVPRIPTDPKAKPEEVKRMTALAQRFVNMWVSIPHDRELFGDDVASHSSVKDVRLSLTLTNSLATSLDQRPETTVDLSVSRLGISIIDSEPQEILYLSAHGLSLVYKESVSARTVQLVLEHMQLDNQQPSAFFPVVLAPSPMPPAYRLPFLQVALNLAKDDRLPDNTLFVQYLSVLLQKMDINVEEALAKQVSQLFSDIFTVEEGAGALSAGQSEALLAAAAAAAAQEDDLGLAEEQLVSTLVWKQAQELPVPASDGSLLVFQYLQLQPVSMRVSFEPDARARSIITAFPNNPLNVLLGFFTVLVGRVDATINFKSFEAQSLQDNPSGITNRLWLYYSDQGMGQVNRVVFNLKVLGNPLDLVENIGSGVVGVFYEPHEGIVHSPEMFGRGMANLFRTTWSSVFNSLSTISETVGTGLSTLSGDDQMIARDRDLSRAQNAPEHVGKGLMTGMMSLGTGIFKGVTGIIVDPIKGAQREGAKGMIKGIGKGLVGVVTKPTAGAVGLVSQSLRGLGNTPSYLLDETLSNQRVRPQRFIDPDRPLASFSQSRQR